MNDLLDLDLSASATTSTSTNGTRPNPQAKYGSGRTTFDYLSSMGSTSAARTPSRTSSPLTGSSQQSTNTSALKQITSTSSRQPGIASNSSGDAFSSLFDSSTTANHANRAGGPTLSMAERLARDNAARFGGAYSSRNNGVLSPSSTGAASSRSHSPALAATSRPGSSTSKPDPTDAWDFDLLDGNSSAPPRPTSNSKDPLDLGFDAPRPGANVASSSGKHSNPVTLDDDDDPFDMGSSLLGPSATRSSAAATSQTVDADDFDLLGAFSKPARPATEVNSNRGGARIVAPRRTATPPPHVLGQIVEMGFSVEQAKTALAATYVEGQEWNVQGALETLMDQAQVEESNERRRADEDRDRRTAERLQEEEYDEPRRHRGRDGDEGADRRKRDSVLQDRPARVDGGRQARDSDTRTEDAAQRKVQEQANELLAQASKFGLSMFKSANAYWETGKATIQKALDEANEDGKGRTRGKERPSNGAPGRPKWWTEDMADDEAESSARIESSSQSSRARPSNTAQREPPPTLFHDSDDELAGVADDVLPQRPSGRPAPPKAQPEPPRPSAPAAASSDTTYKSPWRRAKAAASVSTPPFLPALAVPTPVPRRPTRSPSPPPPPLRTHVSVSSAQMNSARAHKEKGNELFKLGRFGDADASYTAAISALPSGTLALVPLYNNRAAARLKNGEERGAAEDCTEVVTILLGQRAVVGPTEVANLERETLPQDVADINLGEQLGKALSKRAKAFEATEKWSKAGEDWAALLRGGEALLRSAGGIKLVNEGAARCRKMTGDDTSAGSRPAATSAGPTPTTSLGRSSPSLSRASPVPTQRSSPALKPQVVTMGDAARALKAANAAAEAEDDLRLQLKDSVDAKIQSWKGGKEANLRALIASLDNVLWPELGWKTVGMNQLLTDGQLKGQYVRAIAKLHPDKLNARNTTVEQRMVAGQVFGALNDAWNSIKT